MRALLLLLSLLFASAGNCGEAPRLGGIEQFDAGPYGFKAQKVTFRGRNLGYVRTGSLAAFSGRYFVFESCKKGSDEEPDTCVDWRLLDTTTGKVTKLILPDFNPFYATPTFRWPYVAYVSAPAGQGARTSVRCHLFNWQTQKLISSSPVSIDPDLLGTDFPGVFLDPLFETANGKLVVTYSFDEGGKRKALHRLAAP
jgi:hypothetical protein